MASTDRGYDADLREKGITPVTHGIRARKRKLRHDERRYRERWRIEATFCRLKDFRQIATRYDKLTRNYASASALAAVVAFWFENAPSTQLQVRKQYHTIPLEIIRYARLFSDQSASSRFHR